MEREYRFASMDAKERAEPISRNTRPQVRGASRLLPLDVLRGLVMVLMAIDHSSGEFNRGRLVVDATFMWHPGSPLPAAQFLTRWVTHLCAPTFVFLAGTSLALSFANRGRSPARRSAGTQTTSATRGAAATREKASGDRHVDRHLLLRGLFIAGAEVIPSYFWMPPGQYLGQVLYAIGTSYLFMIPLRRLPSSLLLAGALGILVFGEALASLAGWGPPDRTPVLAALLLVPGPHGHVMIAYPTLEWLAILLLGFVFGRWLETARASSTPGDLGTATRRLLLASSAACFALFVLVRGIDRYGTMGIHREGLGLLQWLHVSKYPPSLAYVGLELGIAAALLALAFAIPRLGERRSARFLAVLGRTPMFFYLLHVPLLALLAEALGAKGVLGLKATYGFAALVVVALYPACAWYGRYKVAHPGGIARYV